MSGGVLIIGGGLAAIECARQLRQLGYDRQIEMMSAESYLPYERPPLSKPMESPADATPSHLVKDSDLTAQDIAIHLTHKVVSVRADRKLVETGEGAEHAYDTLVIATGAEPNRLTIPGADLGGVLYLRDWPDAVALHAALRGARSVAVLGGGTIGLEAASTALGYGARVHVVEKQTALMPRSLPGDLAVTVLQHHRDNGIAFELGEEAAYLDGDQTVHAVVLADGRRIDADVVIVGIGVRPRDDLARRAGLRTSDGIEVDGGGRTSDADIFAVGDVACWAEGPSGQRVRHETYNDAVAQAHIVAAVICDQPIDRQPVTTFWSEQTGLMIQGAGSPQGDRLVLRSHGRPPSVACLVMSASTVVGAFGVNSPADFAALKRLIGRTLDDTAVIEDANKPLAPVIREIERAAA